MITDIFRLDDNVPRIYVNESRDFQMLCRLFTYGINPPKYEAEMLHYLNSGMLTNDRLLGNLCEKPGFMDGETVKGEYLRYITENFGRLVRDKGAETGVCNAVYLYLLMYNISTACYVQCDNKEHIVHIGIKSAVKDIQVLYTILKYIIPTGWLLDIFFYAELQVWQGFSYKDTFVNMVRKASATNALYIITTAPLENGENKNMDPIGLIGNEPSPTYEVFGRPDSPGDPESMEDITKYTHVTRYTGSLAINAMSTSTIESFMNNPQDLVKYGSELWDAKYFRFNPDKYERSEETHGKRKPPEEE